MPGLSAAFDPWRRRFEDLASRSSDLSEELEAWDEVIGQLAGSGLPDLEAVEGILRFMEDHPDLDFGAPGPLVHYVERFFRQGYEAKLLESLQRRPISHTVWMQQRVINGTNDPEEVAVLTAALQDAEKRLE